MVYGDAGGATAYLVGEENRGLAAMFVMMNAARLGVGLQGVAIGEKAYQKALAYARERRQGRAGAAGGGMSPIVEHPDVRRMLVTMKALVQAARGICHLTAMAIDLATHADSAEARAAAGERAALLTPVAKAFSTDVGDEVASLGVQVHGGMGFIEETGAAQYLRDSRIAAIYEGTNGIQAIDLVQRKLPLAGGATLKREIADMRAVVAAVAASGEAEFGATAARLGEAVDALEQASAYLGGALGADLASALAGATSYLTAVRPRARRRLPRQGGPRRIEPAGRTRPYRPRALLRRKARDRRARPRAFDSVRRRAARRLRRHPRGERMSEFVEVGRDGAVLVVTLARPEKKNALTGAMYEALIAAFARGER